MNNTAIIPTNNVEGNITNCKIETASIRIDKESPMSFVQYTTYQSYDVCTRQVQQEYVMPEVTPLAVLLGLFIGVIIIAILFALASDPY